ncbi:acetyltransferase [Polynucleobacter paneuropaeus]|jgi:sugar O-acyltransferase (sialic acid O-acetyltransferase NeuD family)|uniref:Sugar O-acyltransferase n=1 Tax=Polynucleobacter paneuropaeus TaxID=2527775 RepID=A0A2Z4JQZ0_9BURK|nr:acetyltransferase [Polynucleobacter paneuropaeus]AWW49190.1 sugar O-acyltransferase [Polynucleobacter paneuropaeus]
MSKIIIFGTKENSELAHYYLKNDSDHEVIAFCVDGKYLESSNFNGLPVVAFEDLEKTCPPTEYKFIAPLAPTSMGLIRQEVFNRVCGKGYEFISYISSRATNFSSKIGKNCFILEDNTLQPYTSIGDNVLMWSGNHIGHHSTIRDHVSITSHVVISGRCDIGSNSFFGVNSTVRDGVKVAEGTFISLGAVITGDTAPWSVYKGASAELTKIPSTRVKF